MQYADDTLLFGGADIGHATVMKCILLPFEKWFGLCINFILLGVRKFTSYTKRIFGCPREEFPLKYLGLPVHPGALQKSDRLRLIEKIKKKLDG